MKRLLLISLFISYLCINWSCEKNNATDIYDTKPEPTAEGTPIGLPVSKLIGPEGGIIESMDGNVMLEIPAGALSSPIDISIQPITNNAPNGTGDAYLFGPESTVFNTPATLTFHYTTAEDAKNMPPLSGIAFQDNDGIWYSTRQFTWDTVNKTVSTPTMHFSGWATFDVLRIYESGSVVFKDGNYQLKVNESAEFRVVAIANDPLSPPANGEEELTPLVKDDNAYDKITKEWAVNGVLNGNDAYGKATPNLQNTALCTYKAPANRPSGSKNPVQLSATLKDLVYKDPATGIVFNNLKLNVPIKIIGDYLYGLNIKYTDDKVSGGLIGVPFTVIDSAYLKVAIKDNMFTFSDFTNSPGVVVPTYAIDGLCSSTWLPEGFSGPLNLTSGTGIFTTFTDQPQMMLTISGVGHSPTFHWVCPEYGSDMVLQGEQGQGSFIFFFTLNDSIQTYLDPSKIVFAKLTPLE